MKNQQPHNRVLYHGDNLPFLRALNCESIDLIAIDPPFNKGKDFHATPDSLSAGASFQDRWSWEKDVHEDWVDQLRDDHPALMKVIEAARLTAGDDMGAFMCFMAVRLLAMHRILKPTGSIFVHLDQKAVHYIKLVMDAIFGEANLRNEIIWFKGYRGTPRKTRFQQEHDTILFYSKTDEYAWNPVHGEYKDKSMSRYNKVDEDGKRYALIKRKRTNGEVYYGKCYPKGKLQGDVIDIPLLSSTDAERLGYPTQKPLALLRLIVEAASNPGDLVLDAFAGCATTCVAAEQLGRRWVGIDLWPKVSEVIRERLEKECDGLTGGEITFTDELPIRTDEGKVAVAAHHTPEVHPTPGPKMTRAQMKEALIRKHGLRCQGCDRQFDHPDFFALDHIVPHRDGGINHISNRTLLCTPCNTRKGARLTLTGLREKNRKEGFMAGQTAVEKAA